MFDKMKFRLRFGISFDRWWEEYNKWLLSVANDPEARNSTYFFKGVPIKGKHEGELIRMEEERNQMVYKVTRRK